MPGLFGSSKPSLKTTVPCNHLPVQLYFVPKSDAAAAAKNTEGPVRIQARCGSSTKNVEVDSPGLGQVDSKVLDTAPELAANGRASMIQRPSGTYYCSPVENDRNVMVGTLIAVDTSSASLRENMGALF